MNSAKNNGPPTGSSNDKSAKLLGLFLSAALLATTVGCGSAAPQARPNHVHVDRNNDGYCDEDGDPMPARGSTGTHSHYYGSPGYYGTTGYGSSSSGSAAGTGHAATISGSSSAHGGIGSSSAGSSG